MIQTHRHATPHPLAAGKFMPPGSTAARYPDIMQPIEPVIDESNQIISKILINVVFDI